MGVSAVNNYEQRNPLSTVIKATTIGGIVGYASKDIIGLTDREKADINYRNIINVGRKNANRQKVNSFKVLKSRTEAQDAFIRLIDNKEVYKNPTPKNVAERLGGKATEIGKKLLAIIENNSKKGMDFDDLDLELGKTTPLGKKITEIISNEANKDIDLDGVIEKFGKKSPEAKEINKIIKNSHNEDMSISDLIAQLGKNSVDGKQVHHMANMTNVFAKENIEHVVKELGGADSKAGKEFKLIIKEVNQAATKENRNLLEVWHKAIKAKRYTAPLILAGATAGFAVAFIHNVLSTKTEA